MADEQKQHDRRIDYIELTVRDVTAARRFYKTVFGWQFTDYGPKYTSFADGRLTGGFAEAADAPASGGPVLVVIYAANLEAVEGRVREHGGTITKPICAFPGGRRFHFTDPNGVELAVWSE